MASVTWTEAAVGRGRRWTATVAGCECVVARGYGEAVHEVWVRPGGGVEIVADALTVEAAQALAVELAERWERGGRG